MKNLTINDVTMRHLLNRLYQKTEQTTHQDPHPGLIIVSNLFTKPYPIVNEIDLLCLATMDLLIKFAYPSLLGYGKFTLSLSMKVSPGVDISFTLGPAIPLTYEDGKLIPKSEIYAHIYRHIQIYAAEIYDSDYVTRIMIRVYLEGKKQNGTTPSSEETESSLYEILQDGLSETEPITAREIRNHPRNYPTHITALKQSSTELKPFMVADTETIIVNDYQMPYAAGIMMVRPGEKITDSVIETYFSEDYSIILDSFEERSTKVLYDFVLRISTIVKKEKSPFIIYFHNLARFDGILLLKHLACHHKSYKLKPLMRNNRLYEIAVYSGKNMLFSFRDSMNLLPGSLSSLANNLCPGLGPKGSIEYDKVDESNVSSMKTSLIDYMKQDIRLLGGVMQKVQEIYWKRWT